MSDRGLISDHAVVRFLERHDGLDLAGVRAGLGGQHADDAKILARLVEMGVDVDRVRRRMTTPLVRDACGSGAAGVRFGHCKFVIGGGRVVTVRLSAWDHGRLRDFGGRPRERRARAQREYW